MTISITLQNLNLTFSHFPCPAGMIFILADQNIIFITNMDHKLFLDFRKLFVVFLWSVGWDCVDITQIC